MGSTWVKLDDTFPSHPKVVAAGDEAAWLYVAGLCHCARHLTDGFIAAEVLGRLTSLRNPLKVAERLVTHRLWHETTGGWLVHDYSGTQRTRAEVEEQRERAKARAKASRERAAHAQRTSPAHADLSQDQKEKEIERRQETEKTDPPNPPTDLPAADYPANAELVRAIRDALRRNPLSLVGEG